jgi:hypothetical protein
MTLLASPLWYKLSIDISLRALIKDLNRKNIAVQWTDQNRICKKWIKEIQEHNEYSWNMFWRECRGGSTLNTSLAKAKERSFRIKLIHDELPTLLNLAKRNPETYSSFKECPWYKEEVETIEHLCSCKKLEASRKEI